MFCLFVCPLQTPKRFDIEFGVENHDMKNGFDQPENHIERILLLLLLLLLLQKQIIIIIIIIIIINCGT